MFIAEVAYTVVNAYQAAGRSVYTDAIAAGFTPDQARREAQPEGAWMNRRS